MSELALDHDNGHVLMRHRDSVSMAELMRCKSAAHARLNGGARQLLGRRRGLQVMTDGRAADHAQQRPDRQLTPSSDPRLQLRPGPAIHPDLAPTTTLSATHQDRAARRIQVGLC